jgi:antitoxin component YwqK of YwqJK toxin-antitoxin module
MEVVIMERPARLHVKWLVVAILLASCSGKSFTEMKWYDETGIRLQNNAGVYQVNGQPFSGIVYKLNKNGKDTVAVASFVNGREDGAWRSYYGNGQSKEKRYFSKGKKTGVLEGWWPNGKKRLLYHFKDGEYEGNCRDWNDKGLLVSNMNYKKGYEAGLQQQFYESGKVKANYMMLDGRRYGLLGTKNCVNVSDSIFKK